MNTVITPVRKYGVGRPRLADAHRRRLERAAQEAARKAARAQHNEAIARRRLQMVELRAQGWQLKQIGAIYGMSEATVCKELKRIAAQAQRPATHDRRAS